MEQFGDIRIQRLGHVCVLEINRPPYNFFDEALIGDLADALEYLDSEGDCRAVVLAAQGKAFSAGADFQADSGRALFDDSSGRSAGGLYKHAVRLFRTRKPIIAAIQGPAIGGGLGLALVAEHTAAMGGTAWVQDRVGGGARFVVELPERVTQTGAAT
jgi:enoyl-CoA hydratase/carnithine racemase